MVRIKTEKIRFSLCEIPFYEQFFINATFENDFWSKLKRTWLFYFHNCEVIYHAC